jgi:prepilin-type N-terminal cleavage/methylation domain-containing protein
MKKQSGYSLIEVLVAIAITSVVLLTVVTLFYMGRRNVYSGKQTTAAVSIGTRMLEDLSAMTAEDVLDNFAIDDNTARTTVNLQGVYGTAMGGVEGQLQFASSATRNTSACTINTSTDPAGITCTNDPNGYMVNWMRMVLPHKNINEIFTQPELGIILTPRNPAVAAEPWTTARFTKVRAYVSWQEGPARRRYAFFDTTKVDR